MSRMDELAEYFFFIHTLGNIRAIRRFVSFVIKEWRVNKLCISLPIFLGF